MSDADSKRNKAAETLQAVARPLIQALTFALPSIISVSSKAWAFYKTLPKNAIMFLTGFIFCFFGGLYPVTFAAVQAAEHGGRKAVVDALTEISDEAMIVIEASKKDDKEDDDKDGKADVNQIDGKELMLRKFNLVITKMDPQKVDNAIGAIYRVWLSVAAVLTLQFARTIALALAISDFLKQPIDRYIAPTVAMATPDKYKKWVPVILGWLVKSIAISIAWFIQSVISAFTSAATGGLMMARATYDALVYRKITLGGLMPTDHEDTAIDEVFSYVFAALGFYFQLSLGFNMPFPFNLMLWPLECAEYYLRWTITEA